MIQFDTHVYSAVSDIQQQDSMGEKQHPHKIGCAEYVQQILCDKIQHAEPLKLAKRVLAATKCGSGSRRKASKETTMTNRLLPKKNCGRPESVNTQIAESRMKSARYSSM